MPNSVNHSVCLFRENYIFVIIYFPVPPLHWYTQCVYTVYIHYMTKSM